MANEPPGGTPAPAPTPAAAPAPPANRAGGAAERVFVIQHSDLFYWWPVWFFGFVFAGMSYWEDFHMAIVPAGTRALSQRKVEVEPGTIEVRDVLVVDAKHRLPTGKASDGTDQPVQARYFVSTYRWVGVVYLFILLVVTFLTNVPLRGLWSFVVVLLTVMITIIFHLAGWWDIIFTQLGNLSIHINLGGYVLLSTALLILWLISFLFLDRQMYVIFTPGQVRICIEIGGAETIYDTQGMVVQKQRVDIFRHWVLGFGSGDLVLRFAKIDHPIEMHNVLNVDAVLKKVERLVQEKVVINEPAAAKPKT